MALAFASYDYAFGRGRTKGVINYYRKHADWEICLNSSLQPYVLPQEMEGWQGSGVIAEVYTAEEARRAVGWSVPVINTASTVFAQDIPSVGFDNVLIGKIAAEHLIECKLDHFAFVGHAERHFVKGRYDGFQEALKDAGGECTWIENASGNVSGLHVIENMEDHAALCDAIATLHYPVGIMAATDRVGFIVLECCRRLGLRVPEDVALVGVDNDSIYTQLAFSSMTSIDPDAELLGFKAAAMLDQLMDGKEPESQHLLIPPKGIILRNSTDRVRSQYPEVARALRFIRNHANEYIDVPNVVDVLPVSRRWLEVKFKEEVGHGVAVEIRRVHIERAKKLLLTTDWPILKVAHESGFNNRERFDRAFQKLVGMPASVYRKTQPKHLNV